MSSDMKEKSAIATPQTLVLETDDGTRLVADLYQGDQKSLVLVIPGFWRTRRFPAMVSIASGLAELGPSVCVVDNRGHGDSTGTFGFNTHEADDLAELILRLRSMLDNDLRVCLMGFSAGGAIAISLAAMRPDLAQGLLLVSPVSEFRRVFPRLNLLEIRHHLSLRAAVRPPRFRWNSANRRRALDDIGSVSIETCLIHTRNDWLVHHSHALALVDAAKRPIELNLLELDHREHADRIYMVSPLAWDITSNFIVRTLGLTLNPIREAP